MADAWQLPLLSGSTVEIVECTDDALEHIADNLKPADREEGYAAVGHRRYFDMMRLSTLGSESTRVAVSAYGEPVAVIGVRTLSLLYNTGVPWMVTVDCTRKHKRALMSLGRAYTAAMLERYSTLTNFVDARNTDSVAWLQRLGFTIEAPHPYGPLAMPFHRFTIAR